MFYGIGFQWRINEQDKATRAHWLLLLCERLKIRPEPHKKIGWQNGRCGIGALKLYHNTTPWEQNISCSCRYTARTLVYMYNRNEFLMLPLFAYKCFLSRFLWRMKNWVFFSSKPMIRATKGWINWWYARANVTTESGLMMMFLVGLYVDYFFNFRRAKGTKNATLIQWFFNWPNWILYRGLFTCKNIFISENCWKKSTRCVFLFNFIVKYWINFSFLCEA